MEMPLPKKDITRPMRVRLKGTANMNTDDRAKQITFSSNGLTYLYKRPANDEKKLAIINYREQ